MNLTPTRPARTQIRTTPRQLAAMAERFDVIGAAELAAEIRSKIAEAERLTVTANDAAEQAQSLRESLVAKIAAGEVDAVSAAAELAKAEELAGLIDPAHNLTEQAKRVILRKLRRRLYDEGDALVYDVLAPAASAAGVKILDAVDSLPAGVDTADAALAAGPKAAKAWQAAVDAIGELRAAWWLGDKLRGEGFTESFRYGAPEPLWNWVDPPAADAPHRPDPIRWAAVLRGHQPTVATAAELLERHLTPKPAA